jgi:hypothetical protein
MSLFTFGFIGSVGPEDGHEELLAAVKGLINSGINLTKYYLNVIPKYLLSEGVVLNFLFTTGRAFSSPFWKQMEPFFGLIIEEDVAYWKQKVSILILLVIIIVAILCKSLCWVK